MPHIEDLGEHFQTLLKKLDRSATDEEMRAMEEATVKDMTAVFNHLEKGEEPEVIMKDILKRKQDQENKRKIEFLKEQAQANHKRALEEEERELTGDQSVTYSDAMESPSLARQSDADALAATSQGEAKATERGGPAAPPAPVDREKVLLQAKKEEWGITATPASPSAYTNGSAAPAVEGEGSRSVFQTDRPPPEAERIPAAPGSPAAAPPGGAGCPRSPSSSGAYSRPLGSNPQPAAGAGANPRPPPAPPVRNSTPLFQSGFETPQRFSGGGMPLGLPLSPQHYQLSPTSFGAQYGMGGGFSSPPPMSTLSTNTGSAWTSVSERFAPASLKGATAPPPTPAGPGAEATLKAAADKLEQHFVQYSEAQAGLQSSQQQRVGGEGVRFVAEYGTGMASFGGARALTSSQSTVGTMQAQCVTTQSLYTPNQASSPLKLGVHSKTDKFGNPIVERVTVGKPVIVSNTVESVRSWGGVADYQPKIYVPPEPRVVGTYTRQVGETHTTVGRASGAASVATGESRSYYRQAGEGKVVSETVNSLAPSLAGSTRTVGTNVYYRTPGVDKNLESADAAFQAAMGHKLPQQGLSLPSSAQPTPTAAAAATFAAASPLAGGTTVPVATTFGPASPQAM